MLVLRGQNWAVELVFFLRRRQQSARLLGDDEPPEVLQLSSSLLWWATRCRQQWLVWLAGLSPYSRCLRAVLAFYSRVQDFDFLNALAAVVAGVESEARLKASLRQSGRANGLECTGTALSLEL